jgi:hypothetical protein
MNLVVFNITLHGCYISKEYFKVMVCSEVA